MSVNFDSLSPRSKDAYIAAWNDTCHGLKESSEHGSVHTYIREIESALRSNKHLETVYKAGITDALLAFKSGVMPDRKPRLTFEELNKDTSAHEHKTR